MATVKPLDPIDFVIRDAKQIACFRNGKFQTLDDYSIACSQGKIVAIEKSFDEALPSFDARELVVLPGLIDSHTHTIFAGSREDEFEMKIQGIPYAEIAARGGGIKNTMAKTRASSEEELFLLGQMRLINAIEFGITTLEMKSGYGLSFDDEMKILRVIKSLQLQSDLDIAATFLGAHTIPPEFSNDRNGYIDLLIEEMIPYIAKNHLAEFCDAFCETNVFTIDETRRIFEVAKQHGLKLKLHADQLTNTGGAELCAEMGAVSADHLEHISDRGIEALKKSNVVAGLLPGCSFYLNMQYPPARKLIEAGIPIALSTDFNPGSCPTQNLQLIMTIACTQMKMTPAEVIQSVTLNAARSLARTDIGNIDIGLQADFSIFQVPNYKFIPYNYGQNHLVAVIKKGVPIFDKYE